MEKNDSLSRLIVKINHWRSFFHEMFAPLLGLPCPQTTVFLRFGPTRKRIKREQEEPCEREVSLVDGLPPVTRFRPCAKSRPASVPRFFQENNSMQRKSRKHGEHALHNFFLIRCLGIMISALHSGCHAGDARLFAIVSSYGGRALHVHTFRPDTLCF